jgi:nitrite reductase (NADH) large subunit
VKRTPLDHRPRLVVIGSGMAAVRVLEELATLAPGHFAITVLGAEPCAPYNRVLLSPVLSGEMARDGIVLHDAAWYAAHRIALRTGVRVIAIDRAARVVRTSDGGAEPYDRVLIATGSVPVRLPVPGATARNVLTYRDAADVDAMRAAAGPGRRAVVIGGGLLGLEAAAGLAARGMRVTVVHLMRWLMERQVDAAGGAVIAERLRERGIAVALDAKTETIVTDAGGLATAVRLADGTDLPADLVVMAIGIRPDIAVAQAAGLYCMRGIVVSDTLQTFDPRIYAVGECVEHRGSVYGLVAPLYRMARVCAAHLAGLGVRGFRGAIQETRLKVTGIEVFSCGDFAGGEGTESITVADGPEGIYRRVVLKGDAVAGAVLVGDATDATWLSGLVSARTDVRGCRDALLFGPEAAAAALPRSGATGESRPPAGRPLAHAA